MICLVSSLAGEAQSTEEDPSKLLALAEEYRLNDQFDLAKETYNQALLYISHEDPESTFEALCGIAYGESVMNNFEGAAAILDKLEKMVPLIDANSALHVNYLNRQGTFFYNQFDPINSRMFYDSAITYHADHDLPLSTYYIESVMRIGELGYAVEDFEQSREHYTWALKLARALGEDGLRQEAECLINIGYFYENTGSRVLAYQFYRDAVKMLDKFFPGSRLQPRAYARMAFLQYEEGDLDGSIASYEEVIRLNEELYGPSNMNFIHNFNAIGRVYQELAQNRDRDLNLKKAREYHERAYELCVEVAPFRLDLMAESLNDVGNTLRELGEFENALASHDEAISMAEVFYADALGYTSYAYSNRGETFSQMERWEEALNDFERSILLDTKDFGEFDKYLSYTYLGLADMYFRKGDYDEALETCQKGLRCIVIGDVPEGYAEAIEGDSELPGVFLEILMLKERILSHQYPLTGLPSLETVMATLERTSNEFETRSSQLLASAKYRPVYERYIASSLDPLVSTLISNYDEVQAIEQRAFEKAEESKGKYLVRELGQSQIMANIPTGLRTELADKRNELTELSVSRDQMDSTAYTQQQFALLRDIENVEERIRSKFPAFEALRQSAQAIDYDQVQDNLVEDEVLLSYFLGDSAFYGFAITSEDGLTSFSSSEVPTLTFRIEEFRRSIEALPHARMDPTRARQRHIDAGQALYQLLLEPFGQKMLSKKSWIVIPDGALALVPFEALFEQVPPDAQYEDIPYLVYEHDINQQFSAAIWLMNNEVESGESPYAGFAPQYDKELIAMVDGDNQFSSIRGDLKPLAHTADEVRGAAQLFEGQAIIDGATETYFEDYANDSEILHLAMHALLDDEDPLHSRLIFDSRNDALNDGELNLWEVFQMDLNAKLVVLSACNTGAGKLQRGEGIESLARGFRFAGVPSLVTSLWQVDDQSTQEIILPFFENLSGGETKSKSLQKAKVDYLSTCTPDKAHPFYWAPLTSIGDNSPMKFGPSTWQWIMLWVGICFGLYSIWWRIFRYKKT